MEEVIYIYPKGFLSRFTNAVPNIKPDDILVTTNDIRVRFIDGIYGIDTLYNTKTFNPLDNVLEAISLASRLFGVNFNTWLDLQLTSPILSVECLAFIEATVEFITTGKRIIPITACQRILQDANRDRYNTEKLKYISELHFKDSNTISILCDWIAQPDGLQDLRYTLEILFGDEKVIEKLPIIQPNPGAMYF